MSDAQRRVARSGRKSSPKVAGIRGAFAMSVTILFAGRLGSTAK